MSRGTPGGGFGIFNPDGSRAVPAGCSGPKSTEAGKAGEPKSMLDYFDWS